MFEGVADLYHVVMSVMLFVPRVEVDERDMKIVVKVMDYIVLPGLIIKPSNVLF